MVKLNIYLTMDNQRKALETIALGVSQGIVSNDVLIKACDAYKIANGLMDDFEYDTMVSKSIHDYLNNVEQDKEIAKAIVPGQTKYVDGVLYVYSATKQGSKTEYGWHVARTSKVGKSSKMSKTEVDTSQALINSLFPTDIDSLTVVKQLGGSTGAQLVKDVNGNEYVKKTGGNTNPDHVRSEYIANMLYNILGQRTPDYELYNSGQPDVTLLSRFIPGTRKPHSGDFAKMGEGFIADILLANWDVYQNDNCLVDAGGNIIRVDNGGSLFYRAQGAKKQPPFDDDVMRTYRDMVKHNSLLAHSLTNDSLRQQIDAAMKKKDDIVAFLTESGEDELAKIFSTRIDNLKKVKDFINAEERREAAIAAAKMGQIPPRTLLASSEMYRELEEDELNEIFEDVAKLAGSPDRALTYSSGGNGWNILSQICQARGFDARPRVVKEADFWKHAATAKLPIMFRGLNSDKGKTAQEWTDMFRYDDSCFYGTQGVWGQGIYAHTDDTNDKYDYHTNVYDRKDDVNNHSTAANYKATKSYKDADSYAYHEQGGILKLAWEDDAKVVNLDDLIQEIQSTPPTLKDKKVLAEIKRLQDALKKGKQEWMDAELALQNISDTIRKDVESKMHYDQAAIQEMYDYIDHTDWGNRTANNEPDYPSYDEFVIKRMSEWVTKNGGTVKVGDNQEYVLFRMGSESISITRNGWDTNAIKRKNMFTPFYNFHAERFQTFMETNCVRKVEKAVEHALKNSKDATEKLAKERDEKKTAYHEIEEELNELSAKNLTSTLYSCIYNAVKGLGTRSSGSSMSVVGIYAAIRGYDGIYVHNGNGENHGFNVILNRSKIITSVE